VVLSYANHSIPTPVNHSIGVPQRSFGGERHGLATRDVSIHTLVREVAEEDLASTDREGSSAILVHACPHVVGRRGENALLAVARMAHDHATPLLVRAGFHPVDIFSVEDYLTEAEARVHYPRGVGGHELRGERGLP
jgi:hypothetical protein